MMNTPQKKSLNLVAQDDSKDNKKEYKGKIYERVYNSRNGSVRKVEHASK